MGTFSQVEPGQKDKADFNSLPKEFFKPPNQCTLFSSYQQKTMKAESPHSQSPVQSLVQISYNICFPDFGVLYREKI